MKSFMAWVKKHLFYTILVIVAAALMIGYLVWLKQPIPLVYGNAENIRIGSIGINGNEPDKYIMVRSADFSTDSFNSDYYKLSDEGEAKLIEELKKYTIQEYHETHEGREWQDSITFPVDFEIDGISYDRYIEIGEKRVTMINNIFPTMGPGSARMPLRPDVSYPTCIPRAEDRKALYESLMQIIKTYGTEYDLPDNSQNMPIEIEINGEN